MNRYLTHTAEDLACDDDFLRWVKYPDRYPQLDAFWRRWLDDYPEKRELVAEARCLVLAVLADDEFLPRETKQGEIWQKIRLTSGLKASSQGISTWKHWYTRAAIVVICLSFAWYVNRDNKREERPELKSESAEAQFVRHVNNAESPNTIVLSDGSSIIMQPQSVLEYPEVFAQDLREVRLTGQAFFRSDARSSETVPRAFRRDHYKGSRYKFYREKSRRGGQCCSTGEDWQGIRFCGGGTG